MHTSEVIINGTTIPVYTTNTIIVGAGAAGMGCAVNLFEFFEQTGVETPQDRIAVVTTGVPLGASRMSGSDKQTYYKMGTSPRVPDTAHDFAVTMTTPGCMHGDLALAEGNGSLRGFYRLVAAGVPFPHDPEGAFLGYKTDHDPYERATSAGPRTSKFMSEGLQHMVERYGIPIMDKQEVLDFVKDDGGRIVAMLTIDKKNVDGDNLGLSVFQAENFVLACGGPGEVYQTTVYPKGQVGIHGIALKAGLKANNITESQYGLASTKFRWNVSGTYMQVVPRIYSTAADGVSDEREFLTEYYETMERLATCIFLKGYQWPFDAQRIDDFQSSLVDMAVHREIVGRGRRVFMDFLKNPIGTDAMNAFALDHLEEEALVYLQRTGALQDLPIERLAHMNQPAIDIYTENGIDLWNEPLEIAVCAQHMNGGFVVDRWWQSNVPRTFVVGEMAGTHGVKRPGGSALNAGQVGGIRSAEYIANVYGAELPADVSGSDAVAAAVAAGLEKLNGMLNGGAVTAAEALAETRARMTRFGAHIRSKTAIGDAVTEAAQQYQKLQQDGLKVDDRKRLADAVQAESMCLTQVALLAAIEDLIVHGGGSRGSYVVLDPDGLPMPEILRGEDGELPAWRPENQDLRATIQEVSYAGDSDRMFTFAHVPVRPIPERDIAFEPAWTAYREKKIFDGDA